MNPFYPIAEEKERRFREIASFLDFGMKTANGEEDRPPPRKPGERVMYEQEFVFFYRLRALLRYGLKIFFDNVDDIYLEKIIRAQSMLSIEDSRKPGAPYGLSLLFIFWIYPRSRVPGEPRGEQEFTFGTSAKPGLERVLDDSTIFDKTIYSTEKYCRRPDRIHNIRMDGPGGIIHFAQQYTDQFFTFRHPMPSTPTE